jgi:hypothetical protein
LIYDVDVVVVGAAMTPLTSRRRSQERMMRIRMWRPMINAMVLLGLNMISREEAFEDQSK